MKCIRQEYIPSNTPFFLPIHNVKIKNICSLISHIDDTDKMYLEDVLIEGSDKLFHMVIFLEGVLITKTAVFSRGFFLTDPVNENECVESKLGDRANVEFTLEQFHGVLEIKSKLCENCNKLPMLTCSDCNITVYCSEECQISHFTTHKKKCTKNGYLAGLNDLTLIIKDSEIVEEILFE